MLKKLAEVVETCRLEVNTQPSAPPRQTIQFARADKTIKTLCQKASEWNMRVDLRKQLQFPSEIVETSLQPA